MPQKTREEGKVAGSASFDQPGNEESIHTVALRKGLHIPPADERMN